MLEKKAEVADVLAMCQTGEEEHYSADNDSPILILLLLTERSVGLWALRDPPKVPNGVLLAATTKTPRERALLATISEIVMNLEN